MHNKPDYHLFKNWGYANAGLVEVFKNDKSFKLQVFAFISMQIALWFITIELYLLVIMGLALFLPVIAELMNSAIERAVDLVTVEHHTMAMYAKDAGSAFVFVTIVLTLSIWAFCLLFGFGIL